MAVLNAALLSLAALSCHVSTVSGSVPYHRYRAREYPLSNSSSPSQSPTQTSESLLPAAGGSEGSVGDVLPESPGSSASASAIGNGLVAGLRVPPVEIIGRPAPSGSDGSETIPTPDLGCGVNGTWARPSSWNSSYPDGSPCNSTFSWTSKYAPSTEPPAPTRYTSKQITRTFPTAVVVTQDSGETCTSLADGVVTTIISVSYTSTSTFYGNEEDYTPEFPTVPVPTYCEKAKEAEPLVPPMETKKCTAEDGSVSLCTQEAAFNPTMIMSISNGPKKGYGAGLATTTFYTTEKNPSVVFLPPIKTPGYSLESEGPKTPPGGTKPTPPNRVIETNTYESMESDPGPRHTITAGPNQVIINRSTFSNIPPGATTTVTVDDSVFEINPSQIIQIPSGATVSRPAPGGGLYVPQPTSTNIGGLNVAVGGSTAVIDGFTYTIGNTPSTEIVKGQTVVIGPTGIDFRGSGQTISFKAVSPEQTEIVVAGGELITAIGKSVVVVMSTTFTYGPNIGELTKVVDDDTIVIGPSGVVVHGKTIGGAGAGNTDTKYEIVGGATITQIGPSKVVIAGTTYTVGPGTGTTTTKVGGEIITIGPDGVSVSTLTLPYPFGPTVVTTLQPVATAPAPTPAETGAEENIGTSFHLDWAVGIMGFCIAIGVWVIDFSI